MKTKIFLLSACLLTATGCVHTAWVKAGASQSEFEQTKATCMVKAAREIPADNHLQLMAGAQKTKTAECKGTKCTESANYTPEQYEEVDRNTPLRDQVYKACLYKNGWSEQQIDDGSMLTPGNQYGGMR